jgi:hypothetical protein
MREPSACAADKPKLLNMTPAKVRSTQAGATGRAQCLDGVVFNCGFMGFVSIM